MKAGMEEIPATMTIQNEAEKLASQPRREQDLRTACMGERIV